MLRRVYGDERSRNLRRALADICGPTGIRRETVRYADAVVAGGGTPSAADAVPAPAPEPRPVACVHFLEGRCAFGERCRSSHDPRAVRPPCRFYAAGNCRSGDGCVYAHRRSEDDSDEDDYDYDDDDYAVGDDDDPLRPLVRVYDGRNLSATEWFYDHHDRLLLLGEGNFGLTRSLVLGGRRPRATSTIAEADADRDGDGISFLWGVDATALHRDSRVRSLVEEKDDRVRSFAWMFPFADEEKADDENVFHERLILGTFHSLAALHGRCSRRRPRNNGYDDDYDDDGGDDAGGGGQFSLALALQGNQLGRWNVLRSALRTGWALTSWHVFDHEDDEEFPGYRPTRGMDRDAFSPTDARFYVFCYGRPHAEEAKGECENGTEGY